MKTLALALALSFVPALAAAQCQPDAGGPLAAIGDAVGAANGGSVKATIAHYNVENFYDEYDSPESACDAPTDPGCGRNARGGMDYLPQRPGDYQKKVEKLALTVVNELGTPDIMQMVEVEGQDDCRNGGSLTGQCGRGMGDGKPDAMQDVANEISRITDGRVRYDVAGDLDAADGRGIMPAFLFRADRVSLAPADANDPVLGSRANDPSRRDFPMNGEVENPKAFNTTASAEIAADGQGSSLFERSAQVVKFRVWKDRTGSGAYKDVYAISGHFKSRPDDFIPRRIAQASYTGGLAKDILAANPNANVIVMGDLNTPYENQLTGLSGALNELNHEMTAASGAYSYNYHGRLQTLDYMFASDSMKSGLEEMHADHINSNAQPGERWNAGTPRGASDHDPIEAKFDLR